MTVQELIEALKTLPPNAKVILLTSDNTEDLGVVALNPKGQVELEGR